jgi:hypothetical protein
MRRGRAQALLDAHGTWPPANGGAAAVDHQPLRAVRQLERSVEAQPWRACLASGGGAASNCSSVLPA